MLSFFNLAKSTYFYTIKAFDRVDTDKPIKDLIIAIFNENKARYGYRRITLELKNRGHYINHKRVKKLMKTLGLFGVQPKTKYRSYKGEVGKVCRNLLLTKIVDEENNKIYYERNFKTTSVNQIWSTDVSEFHIGAGKLYLSPIIDVHNREIISYSISTSPNFKQITTMLDKAFEKHKNLDNLIFHSDQGWQYQHQFYQQRLKNKGIKQSMSRKGNSMDNGMMENFFGLLKTEMFYDQEDNYKTLDDLIKAIDDYICYYNYDRIKVKLKGLSPVNYRLQSSK